MGSIIGQMDPYFSCTGRMFTSHKIGVDRPFRILVAMVRWAIKKLISYQMDSAYKP